MRDIEQLLEDYRPLILRLYKRFHPMFSSHMDKEDLMSEIYAIFMKLVWEYDPRRGVDFPYYIKRMLELRTRHYIAKQLRYKNKETLVEGTFPWSEEVSSDKTDETKEEIEKILNVMSWDDSFSLGEKQRNLFISILRDGKTVKQIAEEEGVKPSTIHTRLHFLVKKLREQRALQDEREREVYE